MDKTYKWFVAVMVGVALIGGIFIYRAWRSGIDKNIAQARASVNASAATQKGQIYNNDKLGVRLLLTNDYLARDYSPVSVFILPQAISAEENPRRFVYLTVVRLNKPEELRDGFNYSEESITRLSDLKIGRVAAVNKKTGEDEWYSYQRLQDRVISGVDMKVFVNEKPQQFPKGTVEYRFIGQRDNRVIVAGGYVGETGDPDLDYKKLDAIISSAVFSF